MHLFRRLAGNILFKIILAFVALSFVLFGVSGFLLGSSGSWVAKIGHTKIGAAAFEKEMKQEREMILNANKSDEALQYLDSDQFKSDVLGHMVNRVMMEKLRDVFGVEASKKIILEAVAKDAHFKKNGKFDHKTFEQFLARHALDEKKYIDEVSNDVVSAMVINSISAVSPTSNPLILAKENFKNEKRVADLVTVSFSSLDKMAVPTDEEIEEFFAKNEKNYQLPEIRTVSYLHFSKQNFAKDFKVSEEEILAEYEKNKDQLQEPESRSFYQILFDDKTSAQKFIERLDVFKANKAGLESEFIKLAKELQKKDKKAITFADASKKDLIPELAEPTFAMKVGELSNPLESPLGFHVFLLTKIEKAHPISFVKAKETLKAKLLESREEKVLQAKISEIDDLLLTSNSLVEVAKKFGLRISSPAIKIDKLGRDENGEMIDDIKGFADFTENAFALKNGQASRIFYAKNSDGFYAVKIEDIAPARHRSLSEVKSQVVVNLTMQKKADALRNMAQKLGDELKKNTKNPWEVFSKYKVKIEKNREFPRVFYIDFQGRKLPYQNEFLKELFKIKLGEVTSIHPGNAEEFIIAILHEIKKPEVNSSEFEMAKQQEMENFRSEILSEFSRYLLSKYPLKTNDKILGKKE